MRPGLEALLRTTTFRLGLVQAGVVLAFVVALLLYVYFETAGQLIRDSDVLADQEYASLERAYAEGGIRRLNQEIVRVLNTAEVKATLLNSGVEVVGSPPQELATKLKSEMAKWGKVIKDAGVRVEQ